MTAAIFGQQFDVGTILGLGAPCTDPIEGLEGHITLRIPEGISPRLLRNSWIGNEMIDQDVIWYDQLPWANAPIVAGLYRLRLSVPDSNRKTFAEQQSLLLEEEVPAPLVLVQLAMLCAEKSENPDSLKHPWIRCPETTAEGQHVAFGKLGRHFLITDFWEDSRSDCVFVAAARRSF